MEKEIRWKVTAGIALITLTLFLMTVHFLLFQDSHHLFIYFLGDLAFLPVEVLLVTLIIDQMLSSREKKLRMEKLNMVIGIFFSRAGTNGIFMQFEAAASFGCQALGFSEHHDYQNRSINQVAEICELA